MDLGSGQSEELLDESEDAELTELLAGASDAVLEEATDELSEELEFFLPLLLPPHAVTTTDKARMTDRLRNM